MGTLHILLSTILLVCSSTVTLINPNFTPVNLVQQSDVVLVIKLDAADNRIVQATVKETLKSDIADKKVRFDFTNADVQDQADNVLETAKLVDSAIMFIGKLDVSGNNKSVEKQAAFLHVNGVWVVFSESNGSWKYSHVDSTLQEVWRGGTDMLIQCVQYIIKDSFAEVPVASNVQWLESLRVGSLEGQANAIFPVITDATSAKQVLYIASESGDKVFSYDNQGAFIDLSEQMHLQSKSIRAVWLDVNGDSAVDLISWDGKQVVLYAGGKDGVLGEAQVLATADALGGDCLSMEVLGGPAHLHRRILIATAKGPMLLSLQATSKLEQLHGSLEKGLGAAGPCLLADLDGDSYPDIMQLCVDGSLVYQGLADGNFAKPVKSGIALGAQPNGAFLANFDANGLLDVLCFGQAESSQVGIGIWHNHGSFTFTNQVDLSGEVYNATPGVIGATLCDINNDGRQDFVVFYPEDYARDPQIFFNRGFRSFGLAADLNLSANALDFDAVGQQTGCMWDANEDGAQDLIMVDDTGVIGAVIRDTDDDALSMRLRLPPDRAQLGPVNVMAYCDDRKLGTWKVDAFQSQAFFGAVEPGEFTIEWTYPGSETVKEEVVLEEGVVRYRLGAKAIRVE